jgi:hypothetical protein
LPQPRHSLPWMASTASRGHHLPARTRPLYHAEDRTDEAAVP